jgi:hypothetical protein
VENVHVYDRIISLRRAGWAHKNSLTPQLVIEVPVPYQQCECLCVFSILFAI